MNNKAKYDELGIFNKIIGSLSNLDKDTQLHMLQSVAKFLKLDSLTSKTGDIFPLKGGIDREQPKEDKIAFKFSDREDIPPKEFMLGKMPSTAVARIACLAYYLTHYRDTKYFKTLDLSKMNTEAAQPKFTNPTQAAKDAAKARILVPATKGRKQISGMGEAFVQALPDKEAAQDVLRRLKPKTRRRVKKKH